jgi:hypothetical protein
MSADNWGTCPRCLKRAKEACESARDTAGGAYGKVTPAEYQRLCDVADQKRHKQDNENLREDYELHMSSTGELYISYSGSCEVCKFSVRFEHTQQETL